MYENQIEWYLANFVIPDDYQKKILDAHRKLTAAYDDIKGQREALKASLTRLKDQYRWGHISRQEYLKEYQETEAQLRPFPTIENKEDELKRLAHFLANVADAWREANQLQRNKLAKVLFEEADIIESKAFLRSFIKRIEIDKSQAVVHYNLPMPYGEETQAVGVLPMVTPGGAEGTRTPDLLRAKEALSQLSYSPINQRYYSNKRSQWQFKGLTNLAQCIIRNVDS